jgi:hypothetical protein
VEKIEVERRGTARRAKLTYLRKRVGKGATLVREREESANEAPAPGQAEKPATETEAAPAAPETAPAAVESK